MVVEERFPLARFAAGLAMALLGVVALGGEMVFGRLVVVLFTVEGGGLGMCLAKGRGRCLVLSARSQVRSMLLLRGVW